MSRDYYYTKPYCEKDKQVKYRRCSTCGEIVHISKLHKSNMCHRCYTQKTGKKICSKCNLYKETDSFWKNKNTKDGYRNMCISCCKNITTNKKKQ